MHFLCRAEVVAPFCTAPKRWIAGLSVGLQRVVTTRLLQDIGVDRGVGACAGRCHDKQFDKKDHAFHWRNLHWQPSVARHEGSVQSTSITNPTAATPPSSCRASRRRLRCSSRSAVPPGSQQNGARSKFSARQSPSSQSPLLCHPETWSRSATPHPSDGNSPSRVRCWRTTNAPGSRGTGRRHSRQPIAGDIGKMIVAGDFSRRGPGPQAPDQVGHDVDTDVSHAEIRRADPAGIAAGRVEQRGNPKSRQQPWQFTRSTAVASSSEPRPDADFAAPHRLTS